MDGEPIQLHLFHGLDRVQRWRSGHAGGWEAVSVSVGVLPDGRWYSATTQRGLRENSWAWPDEQQARTHAAEMMAEGEWVEVPAAYRRNVPLRGPWVLRDGGWVRPD